MWVWVSVSLALGCLQADEKPPALNDLFPGHWVPAQIGVVREHDSTEDTWSESCIEVILRWEPEDPDRLRWLSEWECAEASYWACAQYGIRDAWLITDVGRVPCTGSTTSTPCGGPPEVRLLFTPPEGSPGQVDVCVQQAVARTTPQPFEAVAEARLPSTAEWTTGPLSWRLEDAAPDTAPAAPPDLTRLGTNRAEHSMEYAQRGEPLPARTIRVVLAAFPTAPTALRDFCVEGATLTSGEQAWHPLRVTVAQVSDAPMTADQPAEPARDRGADARPPFWLFLWFPVEQLPADARLTIRGSYVPATPDAAPGEPYAEHVYCDVPIPRIPL